MVFFSTGRAIWAPPFSLGIEGRKSAKKFAAFFADLFEKFRKNFALGDCGHNEQCFPGHPTRQKNRREPTKWIDPNFKVPQRSLTVRGLLGTSGGLILRGFWDMSCGGVERGLSGEAKGPGSLGGPGSWYSHAQTAHSLRKPQAGTPSRARTPVPFPLPKEAQELGGRGPGRKGVPARRGVGVPARGVLRSVRGQEAGIPRAGSPQRAGTPRISAGWRGICEAYRGL